MIPLEARKILLTEGVENDRLAAERAKRLMKGIRTERIERVNDEQLHQIVEEEILPTRANHGMHADIKPIVIFNRFRYELTEEQIAETKQRFPSLFRIPLMKVGEHAGFEWRDSGSREYRQRTGLVCQPAWQLHTIVGCHFRCAYCNLGWYVSIMLNMEAFVSRLDEFIHRCPQQTLFQYDNYTDTVCFEPEYGGARLLIEYFARKPGKALELYVGKSDHVDFLLDLDHRRHTVCCWSLSGRTQSREFEWRAATMEERIEAMRKCQEAGYPVRVRFSPIIPVKNWREENREMINLLFSKVKPDVVTIETIRFLNYEAMCKYFDLSLLDGEFVEVMKNAPRLKHPHGCEVPDDYRKMVYRFIISEIERISPDTPYAFCREKRTVWDYFGDDFARHNQHPDRYICNCGPTSAPATVTQN